MAPLPEHMDPEKLFVTETPPKPEAKAEREDDDEQVEAVADAAEKPEAKAKADAKPDEKDEDDDEYLTLDDLDRMFNENYEKRRKAEREAEEDDDPDLDPRDRELRKLKKENDELRAHSERLAEDDKYRRAKHEMDSCVGKYKMTKEQIDNTIAWFEQNPDLEGNPAWGFERAALRVNPELRTQSPPASRKKESGEGQAQPETAKVITRGAAGGTPPPRPKMQPQRGIYSDVSKHVLASGAASRFFKPE